MFCHVHSLLRFRLPRAGAKVWHAKARPITGLPLHCKNFCLFSNRSSDCTKLSCSLLDPSSHPFLTVTMAFRATSLTRVFLNASRSSQIVRSLNLRSRPSLSIVAKTSYPLQLRGFQTTVSRKFPDNGTPLRDPF